MPDLPLHKCFKRKNHAEKFEFGCFTPSNQLLIVEVLRQPKLGRNIEMNQNEFLEPGEFVDSDHPVVIEYAHEIAGKAKTDKQQVRLHSSRVISLNG